jgi:hypothetical protein
MTVDFSMIAGTNRKLNFTVKDQAFVAVDITDAEIVWVAAVTLGGDPVITKTTKLGTEILITDGPLGMFTVFVVPGDTDDKAGTTFYHEARTIDETIEEVVYQGSFAVTPSGSYGKYVP